MMPGRTRSRHGFFLRTMLANPATERSLPYLYFLRPGPDLRVPVFAVLRLPVSGPRPICGRSLPDGKLPAPVHIIGDKPMNAGKILHPGRSLSVIRPRNLSVSVILQNLGQIRNRYPDSINRGNVPCLCLLCGAASNGKLR